MSTPPQEAETCTIDLSREERWVVHHVLITRVDEAIDDRDTPPEWLLTLVERIEAGTETLTYRHARVLQDELSAYAAAPETPDRDREVANAISASLEETLEEH